MCKNFVQEISNTLAALDPYRKFHENNLGILLFPFLSQEDRKNLSLTNKEWRNADLRYKARGHEAILAVMKRKRTFSEDMSIHEEFLITVPVYLKELGSVNQMLEGSFRVLGFGGTKKAIELPGGRAMLWPNMDDSGDTKHVIAGIWRRIVREEVTMSQLLSKMGILSPCSRLATLSFSPSSSSPESAMPVYLSETFENLGNTKGWFIIDKKNPESSTWKRGEHFLFESEKDRLNESNWDSVMDAALTEVAKICKYDIPLYGDAQNMAFVKRPSKFSVSQYEIRYFGFDFSSKFSCLSIPNLGEGPFETSGKEEIIHLHVDYLLDNAFFYEFGNRYYLEEIAQLKNRLVEKHSKEVSRRMAFS